jgi:hypothetical protein
VRSPSRGGQSPSKSPTRKGIWFILIFYINIKLTCINQTLIQIISEWLLFCSSSIFSNKPAIWFSNSYVNFILMLLSRPCFFENESANACAVSPSHTTILSDLDGPKFTSTYSSVYLSSLLLSLNDVFISSIVSSYYSFTFIYYCFLGLLISPAKALPLLFGMVACVLCKFSDDLELFKYFD